MDNGNNFFKKNWLTLILIALLGGVSIMWIKDINETKAKEEAAVEKADSGAVASQEAVDSLAGTMAKEDSIPQETADPLKDEPVVRLRPSLIKGPACMVANTFESYYPRNVIDGNRATAWGLESYQGSGGTFVFRMPCRRLDHIVVWNGNWGEMGAWEDNARVRRLTISKKDAKSPPCNAKCRGQSSYRLLKSHSLSATMWRTPASDPLPWNVPASATLRGRL